MTFSSIVKLSVLCLCLPFAQGIQRLPHSLHRLNTSRRLQEGSSGSASVSSDNHSEDVGAFLAASRSTSDLVTTRMPRLHGKVNVKHHAGLLNIDGNPNNNIFYWHFAAESNPERKPLVIW